MAQAAGMMGVLVAQAAGLMEVGVIPAQREAEANRFHLPRELSGSLLLERQHLPGNKVSATRQANAADCAGRSGGNRPHGRFWEVCGGKGW